MPHDAQGASDAKTLKFASAANFVAAAVLIPWLALVTALCVAGAIAARESGVDPAERELAVLIGTIGLALFWTAAALHLVVGWCLARRRGYKVALVASAITAFNPTCLPIGLVVAALTWHALRRPLVRVSFDARAS